MFSRTKLLLPFLLAIALGLLISVYPHILAKAKTGQSTWVADQDELGLYLMLAGNSYWNHPTKVSDPIFAEDAPVKYPWIQFAPFAIAAKSLGIPPISTSLLWRIFAGISVAFTLLLLLRSLIKEAWVALAFTLLLLVDSGLLEAKLLVKNYLHLWKLLVEPASVLGAGPILHPEWRIITPGVSVAALLLFYWSCQRFKKSLVPALFLGLLFYTYFYYWTAACLGLLLLALIEPKERWHHGKVLVAGTLLGSIEIFRSYSIKAATSPDWLERSDKFLKIPHLSELIIPKVGIAILLLSAFYVWKKRQDLKLLWCQALAGLLLLNHQILSGLQIENFHWAYHWGPTLSVLIAIIAADFLAKTPKLKARYLWIAITAHAAVAVGLRHAEVSRSKDTLELNAVLSSYRESPEPQASLTSNGTIAGEAWLVEIFSLEKNLRPFSGYSATLSPSIDNGGWHERIAINALLLGQDEETYLKAQKALCDIWTWGPLPRKAGGKEEMLAARLLAYREAKPKLEALIKKYNIRYFVTKEASQRGHLLYQKPGLYLYGLAEPQMDSRQTR